MPGLREALESKVEEGVASSARLLKDVSEYLERVAGDYRVVCARADGLRMDCEPSLLLAMSPAVESSLLK